LRINAPVSFGLLHLAPVVIDFLQRFPNVSVELLVNDRLVDLLEGEFDVGVRIGRLRDSSLIARRIAPIRLAVCAAPDYLARRGTPRTPNDLARHDCLEYTHFESRGEWRLLNSDGRVIVVPVSGRYLANNADVLRTTAIAGGGIALLPTFIVGEDLRAGRLVRLLPNHPPPEQGLHALYPPGQHLPTSVRSEVMSSRPRPKHKAGADRRGISGVSIFDLKQMATAPRTARSDNVLCHARSGRGSKHGRPHRRHARRQNPTGRKSHRALRAAQEHLRRELHRQSQ
jgi:LysR substrate binding domain